MSTEREQILIAEAMGYEPVVPLIPGNLRFVKLAGDPDFSFDPFTDANDDYAVLEWMRKNKEDIESKMKGGGWWMTANIGNEESIYSKDYQIGDYARAALKVLERA